MALPISPGRLTRWLGRCRLPWELPVGRPSDKAPSGFPQSPSHLQQQQGISRIICVFFWLSTRRYLKPMFCESASRVNESSQRVGESPVLSGSKIHTVLFKFLGTFLWLWTPFKCREEKSPRVDKSTSPRVAESPSPRVETAILPGRRNLNFRSDLEKNSKNFGRTSF